MSLFFKALLRSLTEKKARTFLILFSIAVSASLIFANECFSIVCEKRFYEADVRFSGNSDIRILTKDTVGAKGWIDEQQLSKYKELFLYNYGFIKEKALYIPTPEDMNYFTVMGVNIDEFNKYNPLTLKKGSLKDWNGYKAILGTTYAQKYKLDVNDTIKLEMEGRGFNFKIAAISDSKGLFTRELADGGYVLVPKETLSQIFGGGANLKFLKLKDSTQITNMKEKLTKELTDYDVGYGVDDNLIATETVNYTMPFRISAVSVIFMSIFIIYSAFNLVSLERIPLIGTLRSIGCSRKRINRLLISESAFLGILGGLFGCMLGIGVLRIIISIYFSNDTSLVDPDILLNLKAVLTAVLAATIITTASALIPILRTTRIPIKNIILNDIQNRKAKKSRLWLFGLVLLALCVIVPRYTAISFKGMIISCIVSTGALVGMIPIISFVTHLIAQLLEKVPFLRYETVLGIRNLRDNRSLMNNIQLLSASIAIVAFMASIFNSMGSDLLKSYDKDYRFDIQLELREEEEGILSKLRNIDGVKDCIGNYMTDADLPEHNTFLNMVYGIDGDTFFNYQAADELAANRKALATLNSSKNIITSNILKDKLGLKLGDSLLLRYADKEVEYRITGFVETNLGIGHLGYISIDNYKKDTGKRKFTNILIKTYGDPEIVKANIQKAFTRNVLSINTKEDLLKANSDKVIPMFNAIGVYSYIALAVGLIGIINNLAASFLERKRNFAVLRSIGMSRIGLKKMLITETIAVGISGIVFGLTTAIIMSPAIPSLVSMFWGKVTVSLPLIQISIMSVTTLLAMFILASIPAAKGNKLSIIQSIKYE